METFYLILQISILCFTPYFLNRYLKGTNLGKWLSPVVMAYLIGILIALLRVMPLNEVVNKYFTQGSILIAIPLLLFNADIKAWIKHAGSTVLSFVFCIIAALISATIFGLAFHSNIDKVWEKSGMLVGIFTGGTANLNAVGLGVGASEESMIILNTSEILWGGLYLIFLTSLAPRFYGLFLSKYKYYTKEKEDHEIDLESSFLKSMLIAIGLSLVVVAITVGVTIGIYGNLDQTSFIILLLTSLSVAASFYTPVRQLKGSYEAGDYLLLVFCIAIGMTFDLTQLISSGGQVFLFTGAVMLASIFIHLGLSKLFKIDRDTTIITSTAAIYGPAFIGQVANVLENRQIVFAGMSTGLVGYAVGNFLGISLSNLLNMYLL